MSTDRATERANEQIVRRLYSAFAALDQDRLDDLLAQDFRAHGLPPGCTPDAEGLKAMMAQQHAGLRECRNEIEDVIAQDDRVAVRYTTRALHTGALFGIPPTGRRVTMTGIEIYRVRYGRVVEMWSEGDMSELFADDEDPATAPAPV